MFALFDLQLFTYRRIINILTANCESSGQFVENAGLKTKERWDCADTFYYFTISNQHKF